MTDQRPGTQIQAASNTVFQWSSSFAKFYIGEQNTIKLKAFPNTSAETYGRWMTANPGDGCCGFRALSDPTPSSYVDGNLSVHTRGCA